MNWRHAAPLLMVVGIGFFSLAFVLWKRGIPGRGAFVAAGTVVFFAGWILRIVDRTACFTCARCGWRGTKRRWRKEGCCPSCGEGLHWQQG